MLWYIILVNCIIVDYFILLCRDYLFSIVFYDSLSIFIFYSSISFTFTLQIVFHLVLHLLFYLAFVLLYLLFILRNSLSQKCGEKTNSFILFSVIKTRFIFFVFLD